MGYYFFPFRSLNLTTINYFGNFRYLVGCFLRFEFLMIILAPKSGCREKFKILLVYKDQLLTAFIFQKPVINQKYFLMQK